jgi:GH43 family beta-xylosidase
MFDWSQFINTPLLASYLAYKESFLQLNLILMTLSSVTRQGGQPLLTVSKLHKLFLATVTLLVVSWLCPFTTLSQTFRNPLRNSGPDPFVVFYNGFYYITYTINYTNYPGGTAIEVVKARSLADLHATAPTVVWTDNIAARSNNMWAPELHRLNGPNGYRWYLYYTAGTSACCENQRTHVLESSGDDPLGPYTYKARIFDANNDGYAIDGAILQKNNGSLYFLWAGDNTANLYIASMSNPWTLSSSRVRIATPKYDWEKQSGTTNEGAAVLKRAGKIFITYSANSCVSSAYSLGLLTVNESDDLLNTATWTNAKSPTPVLTSANGAYGTGHNGFFKSPDGTQDWIVYHATANSGGACDESRTPRAHQITWNTDGTPNFGTPQSTSTALTVPSGDPGGSSPITSGNFYRLINKYDATQALHLTGNTYMSFTDVFNVVGTPKSWNAQQQIWKIESAGNGYYKLTNKYDPNTSLHLTGNTYMSFTDVYKMVGTPKTWNVDQQLWSIESAGNGYYKFINKYDATQALHLTGNTYMSFTDVYNVVGTPKTWNIDQQLWQLEDKGTTGARLAAQTEPANESLQTLQAYPNPADGELTVRFDAQQTERVSIGLVNTLGVAVKRVFEGEVQAGERKEITLSTAKLTTGTYFISVEKLSGKQTTKVLIVH